jgi:hypothetical protein
MKLTNGWQFKSLAIVDSSLLSDAVTVHAGRKWGNPQHKQVDRTCTSSRYNTLRDNLRVLQAGYTPMFLTYVKHTALVVSLLHYYYYYYYYNIAYPISYVFSTSSGKTPNTRAEKHKTLLRNTIRKCNWCTYSTQQPAKYVQYGYWL